MGKEQKKEELSAGKQEAASVEDPRDTKINDLTESLQRLQAEFENFKKRTEKEKLDFCKYAEKDLITNLLPILDNFELALNNTQEGSEFIKGIELIYAQLVSELEKKGLEKIESLGQKFDPYKHEALMQEESKEKEGTILEELQKGYQLNNLIIRTAKVKVSK